MLPSRAALLKALIPDRRKGGQEGWTDFTVKPCRSIAQYMVAKKERIEELLQCPCIYSTK
jgi:hypothetical protein